MVWADKLARALALKSAAQLMYRACKDRNSHGLFQARRELFELLQAEFPHAMSNENPDWDYKDV